MVNSDLIFTGCVEASKYTCFYTDIMTFDIVSETFCSVAADMTFYMVLK